MNGFFAVHVRGTTKLVTWVLGLRDRPVVLEAESLHEQVAAELERAAATYLNGSPDRGGVHAV